MVGSKAWDIWLQKIGGAVWELEESLIPWTFKAEVPSLEQTNGSFINRPTAEGAFIQNMISYSGIFRTGIK